jgi:hypothetical protein
VAAFAVLEDQRNERVHRAHCGHQVELDEPRPFLLGGLYERRVSDDPHRVREHVHPAQLGAGGIGEAGKRRIVGRVDAVRARAATMKRDLVTHGRRALGVDVGDEHIHPLGGKPHRDPSPDPAPAADDHRASALQLVHRRSFRSPRHPSGRQRVTLRAHLGKEGHTVGEKYDDCYEYEREPLYRIDPNYRPLQFTAVPQARFEAIARWDTAGQAAFAQEMNEPGETIRNFAEAGIALLQSTGSGATAAAGAGRAVVGNAMACFQATNQQFAKNGDLMRRLDRLPHVPKAQLKDAALASGRNVVQTATKHLSDLQVALNTVLGPLQDMAVNALHTQAEAIVNRTLESAVTNTGAYLRAAIQRGMADPPEEGQAAV